MEQIMEITCHENDMPTQSQQVMHCSVQEIFERLPAAILLLDRYGVVKESNPVAKKLLGTPLVQERWRTIIEREMLPEQHSQHYITLRRGYVVSIATQSLDSMPGQLILLNDVTAMQQLQQKVAHYQRLSVMGEMAASLAHQIRTPLATALLYSKMFSDPAIYLKKHCADHVKYADKMTARLKHIETHIKDMLLFAKGDSVNFSTISLKSLMQQLYALCEHILQDSDSACEIDYDSFSCCIKGNADLLLGALQNCIQNAIDCVSNNAKILIVGHYRMPRCIDIVIHDQGPGIEKSILDKVTDPFFTTRANGTGLGLAVTKMVCESHGGQLSIQSDPQHGTTMTLRLPIVEEI